MPDGFEVLIWGAVMAALWLRGLSRTAQRRRQAELEESSRASGGEVPAASRQSAAPVAAPPASSAAGRRARTAGQGEGPPRLSLRGQLGEFARQLQEQAEMARAEAAREAGALQPDEERTVLVPGRRVIPASSVPVRRTDAALPVADARGEWHDPNVHRASIKRRSRSESHDMTKRPARGGKGLERLDRLSPLQRAMVLSEIFGNPPGLDEAPTDLDRRY